MTKSDLLVYALDPIGVVVYNHKNLMLEYASKGDYNGVLRRVPLRKLSVIIGREVPPIERAFIFEVGQKVRIQQFSGGTKEAIATPRGIGGTICRTGFMSEAKFLDLKEKNGSVGDLESAIRKAIGSI